MVHWSNPVCPFLWVKRNRNKYVITYFKKCQLQENKIFTKVCLRTPTPLLCFSSSCVGHEDVHWHRQKSPSASPLFQDVYPYGILDFLCPLRTRTSVHRGGIRLSIKASQTSPVLGQLCTKVLRNIVKGKAGHNDSTVLATLWSRWVHQNGQWTSSCPKMHSMTIPAVTQFEAEFLFLGH